MVTPLRFALLGLVFSVIVACDRSSFVADRDPGGCPFERVAVEDGVNSYRYDSLSPDGRTIAIAWDRGEEQRGTYPLDLNTGKRTDLPEFNNGAVFSPDGSGRIVRRLTDHPEKDAYPFTSANGEYLYFMSYRDPQGVYRIPINASFECG